MVSRTAALLLLDRSQEAAPERVPHLLPPQEHLVDPPRPLLESLGEQEAALTSCSCSSDAPLCIYISKMVSIPFSALPGRTAPPENGSKEVFLAFG